MKYNMKNEIIMTKTELRLWRELDHKLRMSGKDGITKRQFLALPVKERQDFEDASMESRTDAGSTF